MTKIFRSKDKCPGEQMLAAYADQNLVGDERHEVEKHLVWCDECLHQLGSLVHTEDLATEATPDHLLRCARNLGVSETNAKRGWQWLPVPLFAVLAFLVFALWKGPAHIVNSPSPAVQEAKSSPPPVPSGPEEPHQVRGGGSTGSFVLSPKPGERLARNHSQFRWEAQKGAEYYDVQLMTESGDLVWKTRSASTSVTLPRSVQLTPGSSYFLLIRAHIRNAGITESAPVEFTAG